MMVKSNAEGVEKVLTDNGKFAFLMESTSIQVMKCSKLYCFISVQYIVERECDLAQIGGSLDTKG